MNNQEAKLILQAYRTNGLDARDPMMEEALEQAKRDPELQKWFAQEQALDSRLQRKLVIEVPAELKANLLALQKMAQPAPRRQSWMWLAAAAAVALVLGIASFLLRPAKPTGLESFREAMVGYSLSGSNHVAIELPEMAKIQSWLKGAGMDTKFELPAGLRGQPPQGCRVVDWNGRKASMICFMLDGDHHVDIFVVDSAALPELAANGPPQFAEAGGEMTVMWASNGQAYLIAGGGDRKFLEKLLQPS